MGNYQDENRPGDNGDGISEVSSPRPASTNADEEKFTMEAKTHLDYAGSAAKTDPEEIRLVRKLDLWMLVCDLSRVFYKRVDVDSLTMLPAFSLHPQLSEHDATASDLCYPLGRCEQ